MITRPHSQHNEAAKHGAANQFSHVCTRLPRVRQIVAGLIAKNSHIDDWVCPSVFSSIMHCVLETNNNRTNVLTHIFIHENLET